MLDASLSVHMYIYIYTYIHVYTYVSTHVHACKSLGFLLLVLPGPRFGQAKGTLEYRPSSQPGDEGSGSVGFNNHCPAQPRPGGKPRAPSQSVQVLSERLWCKRSAPVAFEAPSREAP